MYQGLKAIRSFSDYVIYLPIFGGGRVIEIQEYELYLIDNEIAENTRKNYLNTLKQLNNFLEVKDCALSKAALIQFKQYLREHEYKPKKKYTLKTINQKITSINVYLNWLEQEGFITDKLSIKLLKTQTSEHRESITKSDYRKLLNNCDDEELELFILTIGNTGVRITEVCSLKASDLNQKTILVENKGKERAIAMPQFLKKRLKKFVRKNGITDIIFAKNQRTYRAELKELAGKAKVNKDKVYPHSIRHYFAKAFLENGGDSTVLQQLLGHKQIATTTIYTKLNTNELSEQFSNIKNI